MGHQFVGAHDGGYDVLEITFSDFGPGEQFLFSVDVDPTTIRGAPAPGPNESGSVSGLELVAATINLSFSDGSELSERTFGVPGSLSESEAIVAPSPPAPAGLTLLGVPAVPAAVSNASQTARVSGPAGATIALLVIEAGLFTAGVAAGGFDIDPFEANSALAVTDHTATIGAGGFVDVPVTLTRANADGGYNHLVAVIRSSGRTGPTSPVQVLQLVAPVPGDDDGDGFAEPADCNDSDPGVFPGAAELCDGVDNDCDGQADEADCALCSAANTITSATQTRQTKVRLLETVARDKLRTRGTFVLPAGMALAPDTVPVTFRLTDGAGVYWEATIAAGSFSRSANGWNFKFVDPALAYGGIRGAKFSVKSDQVTVEYTLKAQALDRPPFQGSTAAVTVRVDSRCFADPVDACAAVGAGVICR